MNKFIQFKTDISHIQLPPQFTFPHNYTPHLIAEIASKELQEYLLNKASFTHDFGVLNPENPTALGKMFGVLVVKNSKDEIGYLAAFSGKIDESNLHKHFVPPVFDILDKDGFYKKTENEISIINTTIHELENDKEYLHNQKEYDKHQKKYSESLQTEKLKIKKRQQERKQEFKRQLISLEKEKAVQLQQHINQLKINESFYLREYEEYLDNKLQHLAIKVKKTVEKVELLKEKRAQKSAWVQQKIFKCYSFVNSKLDRKNLLDLFTNSKQNIPAGAGDCCAPKLLQYAFLNHFTPICMAEFWWGKPLQSSVRKHTYYYPACIGKCKPILTHMLNGINVEENPIFKELKAAKDIKILFEDEAISVIHKPVDLLSVSGNEVEDSIYTRIKKLYPNATGPLIVHRLDMSTSGILLIAKTKEAHKFLQEQFKDKTIKKRYVALLDGIISERKGTISLPLKVDFHHRPKQMVCFEHGKPAKTKWEVIDIQNNQTKINLYPITGRTHQLRMHMAHHSGLNTPIVGDDLYGKKANRLHLHAAYIGFIHPTSKKWVEFYNEAEF